MLGGVALGACSVEKMVKAEMPTKAHIAKKTVENFFIILSGKPLLSVNRYLLTVNCKSQYIK